MATYRLTRDARRDLSAIREFTKSRWGNEQSKKYILELRRLLTLLSDNPSMGIRRRDIDEGVYSFPHASHVIYYIIEKKYLIVIGVLHSSMAPTNHLEGRTLV